MMYFLKSVSKEFLIIIEDNICIDADVDVKHLIGKTLEEIKTFVLLKSWQLVEGE